MIILSFLFLLTATLYSSVGFGGGSTYLALLLIWDVPYLIFPVIALFCNIIVVSGNCINYIKAGNINFKILAPYLISSMPLAFIGGSLSVDKEIFEILLFLVLALAGVLLLVKFQSFDQKIEVYKKIPTILSLLIGASIGFVSGVVGIGGGIFLSPILLLIRVDSAKNIATAASLIVLSGLALPAVGADIPDEQYVAGLPSHDIKSIPSYGIAANGLGEFPTNINYLLGKKSDGNQLGVSKVTGVGFCTSLTDSACVGAPVLQYKAQIGLCSDATSEGVEMNVEETKECIRSIRTTRRISPSANRLCSCPRGRANRNRDRI